MHENLTSVLINQIEANKQASAKVADVSYPEAMEKWVDSFPEMPSYDTEHTVTDTLEDLEENTPHNTIGVGTAVGSGLLGLVGGVGLAKLVSAIRRKRKQEDKDMNEKLAGGILKPDQNGRTIIGSQVITNNINKGLGALTGIGVVYGLNKLWNKYMATKALEKEEKEEVKQAADIGDPEYLIGNLQGGVLNGAIIGGTIASAGLLVKLAQEIYKQRERDKRAIRDKKPMGKFPGKLMAVSALGGLLPLAATAGYGAVQRDKADVYNTTLDK